MKNRSSKVLITCRLLRATAGHARAQTMRAGFSLTEASMVSVRAAKRRAYLSGDRGRAQGSGCRVQGAGRRVQRLSVQAGQETGGGAAIRTLRTALGVPLPPAACTLNPAP